MEYLAYQYLLARYPQEQKTKMLQFDHSSLVCSYKRLETAFKSHKCNLSRHITTSLVV